MQNTGTLHLGEQISSSMFSEDENFGVLGLSRNLGAKNLTSCINYFYTDPILGLCHNSELSDKKSIMIAIELAKAIDKNSASTVKEIKAKYCQTKEFAQVKDFLNKKCKQVWNVYENPKNVPFEAMRALGITNKPSLENLLDDTLKIFEKDNGITTVEVIQSILNNKNFGYSFEDIYNFLKSYKIRTNCKFNLLTVSYLLKKSDYNKSKIKNLGIEPKIIDKIIKTLPLGTQIKIHLKNLFNIF
jgi:hypothetical protein